MRELTAQELQAVSGGDEFTGITWEVAGGIICIAGMVLAAAVSAPLLVAIGVGAAFVGAGLALFGAIYDWYWDYFHQGS